MNKLTIALLLSATLLSSFGTAAVRPANAQGYDDGYRRRYRAYGEDRYDGYRRCQATVRATGIGYPFGIFSRNSAIKAWRREAQAVYDTDFAWTYARDKFIECKPYLAVIRCTAIARPCI